MMVMLVAVLDVTQYLECLIESGGLHLDLLETTLQGSVLLYRVTILVEGCGSDALYCSTSQCRLHDICSIHRTRCRTGSDDGVYLVDKHYHVGVGLYLFHQGLQTLLKLSAIFRASYYSRHVEGVDTFAEEHRRGTVVGYLLCKALYDSTLTNAWLTYQYGVILFSAPQDLYHSLYLLLTAYTGVEFSVESCLSEVCAEGVEHWGLRVFFLLGSGRRT